MGNYFFWRILIKDLTFYVFINQCHCTLDHHHTNFQLVLTYNKLHTMKHMCVKWILIRSFCNCNPVYITHHFLLSHNLCWFLLNYLNIQVTYFFTENLSHTWFIKCRVSQFFMLIKYYKIDYRLSMNMYQINLL